jgi:hypothetical protein
MHSFLEIKFCSRLCSCSWRSWSYFQPSLCNYSWILWSHFEPKFQNFSSDLTNANVHGGFQIISSSDPVLFWVVTISFCGF